ncbi:DegT/DnrJ/EryC1/StrS family aminotransferase [Streptomyces sp. NPDC012693]|uniref:DegT/DnrJ/EryC1/StrS family aminotransferase n=1 Tax=unclassified Streptomyces TaxID=2593676 RepID=UPI00202EFC2B|nr:DegT/DnrJ/EryC1/StrS family aminotransferase [Streptomyces sp. MSC1_001]
MKSSLPARLGGVPALESATPLARPTVHADPQLYKALHEILESGQLTNGAQVAAFEREVAEFLGVEHVVAVSNCTTGLLMVLRCLGLSGEVVLPSFTFIASGHVVLWNGLRPVFADIDRETFTLDPDRVAAATGSGTGALLATHTFGAPCDMDALERIAEARGVPLVVDAAHGFGGRYPDGSRIGGRGIAEVFSLSPTKPFTTGEGGIIATRDATLAGELRTARNYGNPGSYDSVLLGLNGRLTEFSAILGRRGLPHLPEWLERRRELAARYRDNLDDVPGISFQRIPQGAVSVYKDLSVVVDPEPFGLDRDRLAVALEAEGIPTRAYFDPPLHRQSVYQKDAADRPAGAGADAWAGSLGNTEWLSARALTLPLYTRMAESVLDRICDAVRRVHDHAEALRAL